MSGDVTRLVRWLKRARPPRAQLTRALLAGTVAAVTNIGLLIGAVALLVESATRPGLRAVAGALIVIELLAFLRSPLRFLERLSAHRLGFSAVTRWRRWLIATVGRWDYSRWQEYAAGDLLERSLRDTDELQDLWLRFALPVITTSVALFLGDFVLALLPPRGRWLEFAFIMLVVQVLSYAILFANLRVLVQLDHALRIERSAYLAAVVELSAVTPELSLLGHDDFAAERLNESRLRLGRCELQLGRARRRSNVVPVAGGVLSLAALVVARPHTSPLWIVVSALLAVANADSLSVVRGAIDTAVAVSAAADRLEELDSADFTASSGWPVDATFRAEGLSLIHDDVVLVEDATFTLVAGTRVALVGASGSGKSTLLRAMCGLDRATSGHLSVGGVELTDINEEILRAKLAYVASEPGLTRGYVTDVIRLGRSSARDAIIDLQDLGLVTDETTRWDELSRGERQRVAIVRALVTSPEIIVLDEPTSGLGGDETSLVLSLLETSNATVVIATHDPRVIEWCDDVLELADHHIRPLSR